MNFSKGSLFVIITPLIVLAIVDILIFALVKNWSTGRWIDVGFINLAFILFVASYFLVPNTGNSDVFGLSNSLIIGGYLVVELILGCALIAINNNGIWPIVAQVILLLLALLVFIPNLAINHDSAIHDNAVRNSHRTLVNIQDIMFRAMKATEDREVRRTVERAYDKSRSISGYGRKGLEEYDEKLTEMAEDILSSAQDGDNDTILNQCRLFMAVCEDRAIAVRNSQRR
ncbi:hypothetical protein [Methanomethylophilus alvi]|uniref:hypothetical protein n=1 Tax=Methanomethylophilus alvi TaxID=1291540 RepID=UPI0037DC0FE6